MTRLAVVLALSLAACGGSGTAATTTTTTAAPPATSTTAAATTTSAPTVTTADPGGPTGVVSYVAGDGTEARFVIGEVLLGNNVTVVATNTAVEVEVTVDFDEPTNSVLGPVSVSASGFVTDEGRRNGAIQRFILESSTHPRIVFQPTDVAGLVDALATGAGTVTGDLVIREVGVPVTFDVTVLAADTDGIRAVATARVDRTDWGLTIPNVASVASVDEELVLELDLVLVPVS